MRISRVISALIFLLLTACAFTQSVELLPIPSASPLVLPQATPVPTRARDLHPIEVSPVRPTPTGESLFQCDSSMQVDVPSYTVDAQLNYAKRAIQVAQEITFTNQGNVALASVVLNARPNWQSGVFNLKALYLNKSQNVDHKLVGQRLEVTLPQSLDPTCTLRLTLEFELRIPPIDMGGTYAYQGYLGYSDRQTNLGQWLPVIAVKQGNEWISHEEIAIGEQEILNVANWNIHFRITDAPNTLRIAAPGIVEKVSDNEWHFILSKTRDFSLSIGENYRVLQQVTSNEVTVELYTFDDAIINSGAGAMDSAAYALNTAVKSVGLYESLYGDYPLGRLVLVQADFPDGMEFSGIVFIGGEYFRGLSGVESYLTLISVHEIAHQWWYSQVGNDQALHPWLDEALATYSELVFIEKFYPTLVNWWWDFRVNRLLPEGFVDSTVYEFSSRRAYINAVYLRGVLMLRDLRQDLGDDVFFGWLNRYAASGSGRIMTPDEFWSLLTPQQLERTTTTRDRYLKNPQIITLATPSS